MAFSMALAIDTSNSAFDDDACFAEVARIARAAADQIEAGQTEGQCRDVNGNKVGVWKIRR